MSRLFKELQTLSTLESSIESYLRTLQGSDADSVILAYLDRRKDEEGNIVGDGQPKIFIGVAENDDDDDSVASGGGGGLEDSCGMYTKSVEMFDLMKQVHSEKVPDYDRVILNNKAHSFGRVNLKGLDSKALLALLWRYVLPLDQNTLTSLISKIAITSEAVFCEDCDPKFVPLPGSELEPCTKGCRTWLQRVLTVTRREIAEESGNEPEAFDKDSNGSHQCGFCTSACGVARPQWLGDNREEEKALSSMELRQASKHGASVTTGANRYAMFNSHEEEPDEPQLEDMEKTLKKAKLILEESEHFLDNIDEHYAAANLATTRGKTEVIKTTGAIARYLSNRTTHLFNACNESEGNRYFHLRMTEAKLNATVPTFKQLHAEVIRMAEDFRKGGGGADKLDAIEKKLGEIHKIVSVVEEIREDHTKGGAGVQGIVQWPRLKKEIDKLDFSMFCGDYKPRDWNEELQSMLDIIRPKEAQNVSGIREYEKLYQLAHDFVDQAEMYGKIILAEQGIPMQHRTIPPAAMGGQAGGEKFNHGGILFKFAVDWKGMYGGDELAMKVAGHELKGLAAYSRSKVPQLCQLLMCTIDYRGSRLVAMPVLPVKGAATLKYGSADGGITVHIGEEHIEEKMIAAAKRINLKGHKVSCKGEPVIHGPCDIECHQGTDGRIYVLDFGRVFPPEPPLPDAPGSSFLYRLLRPELVRMTPFPLSPDCFSMFASDHGRKENDAEVVQAHRHLLEHFLPHFCTFLSEQTPEQLKGFTHSLSQWLHRDGINVRLLGVIEEQLRNLKNEDARNLVITEMVARCIKNEVRHRMRVTTSRNQSASEEAYRACVLEYWNDLLTGDRQWEVEIPKRMEYQFPMVKEPLEIKRADVDIYRVFSRVQMMTGISLTTQALNALYDTATAIRNGKQGHASFSLVESDLESISTRVKHVHLVSIAEGKALLTRAQDTARDRKKRHAAERLLDLALLKFQEAVASVPDDEDGLCFCGDVMSILALYHGRDQLMTDAFDYYRQGRNAKAVMKLAREVWKEPKFKKFLPQAQLALRRLAETPHLFDAKLLDLAKVELGRLIVLEGDMIKDGDEMMMNAVMAYVLGSGEAEVGAVPVKMLRENALKVLRAPKFKFGVQDALIVAGLLSENNTLDVVHVGGEIPIGKLRNNEMPEVILEKRELGVPDAIILAAALVPNDSMTKLSLADNEIGNQGVMSLVNTLMKMPNLTRLDLRHNGISSEGAKAVGTVVKWSSSLKALDIWRNPLGHDGLMALYDGLKNTSTLVDIDLGRTDLGVQGAEAVAEILRANTSLQNLNMGGNTVKVMGTRYLADALVVNETLQSIDLKFNELGDEGVELLCLAFSSNKTLRKLNLRNNGIGALGATALAQALAVATCPLHLLDVESNAIDDEGATALSEALQINTSLRALSLRYNHVGDLGGQRMAEVLAEQSTLTNFDIRSNKLQVETEAELWRVCQKQSISLTATMSAAAAAAFFDEKRPSTNKLDTDENVDKSNRPKTAKKSKARSKPSVA